MKKLYIQLPTRLAHFWKRAGAGHNAVLKIQNRNAKNRSISAGNGYYPLF
jgi:hypothetical protein